MQEEPNPIKESGEKKKEQDLMELRGALEEMVQDVTEGIMLLSRDFRIIWSNRNMMKQTGYEKLEGMRGRYCYEVTHSRKNPCQPPNHICPITEVLKTGRASGAEHVHFDREGNRKFVEVSVHPVLNEKSEITRFVHIDQDITEKKRVEQELLDSRNYNRGLIESSVDALVTFDKNGIILDVNEETVRLTGYKRDGLVGSPFKDYFTDSVRAQEGVDLSFSEGVVRDYELVMRSKTGKETLVSYNANVYRDSKGGVEGVFASARDITEKKKLERQLQESGDYNRGLIESSVDALVTFDKNGIILDVNEGTVRLTGYKRDGLIGSPFKNYFTDPEKAREGVMITFRDGVVRDYELVMRSKTGKETIVSYNATVYKNSMGRIEGAFAAARDITENKRLEKQLRESRNYNRGLIESSVDALVTFDKKGVILDVNEETVRLTGYGRDELVGSPFRGYFTDPVRAQGGVDLSFEKGVVRDYELIIRSKNGQETLVSYNANVYRDSKGGVEGVFASARDITEKKRLEERFRALYGLSSKIDVGVDEILEFTADEVTKMLNPDMCYITSLEGDNLFFRALRGNIPGFIREGMGVKVSKTICGLVIEEKKPVVIPDIEKDPVSERYPYLKEYNINSYVGIPLIDSGGNAVGTICIVNKEHRDYSKEDVELLSIFADRVSLAVERAEIEKDLLDAKAELQESEEHLKTILDSVRTGIVIIDAEKHEIVDVNSFAAEMIGARKDQILGSVCHGFICPAERGECPITDLKQAVDDSERMLVKADGEKIPILKSVIPITQKGHRYLIESFIDITERKKAEEELKKKMGEIERFNKLMVGRELKMIELKKRIAELEAGK